jgi:hypothetical protein
MSYQVIDSKSEKNSYGAWVVSEDVKTTLSLVYMGNNIFALNYDSVFSGLKSGQVQGGPISVSRNTTIIVNNDPKVTVAISQFNLDLRKNYVFLHVKIDVDIPVIGSETIYEQTLGGNYNPSVNG